MKETSTKRKSAGKTVNTGVKSYVIMKDDNVKKIIEEQIEIDLKINVISKDISNVREVQLQNIFLNAPAALAIFEGLELKYTLANKRYQKLCNRNAEDLIGKAMHEVFPELIGSGTYELFHHVLKTGETFSDPEYPVLVDLKKNGELRQCYFNFSMEALRNDSGNIYAVMAMSYDITEQVEARKKIEENEKQQSFLLKLSDAIRPLDNPIDIEEAITKVVRNFLDADGCHYCTINEDKVIILRGAAREGFPSVAGVYPISSFALLKAVLDAGRPFIVNDVYTTDILDEELKQLCLKLKVVSFINVPVIKNGKAVGLISVVQSSPRKWTELEVLLTKETAERAWAAVERAKAEDSLRRSEEKYRTVIDTIDEGFSLLDVLFDNKKRAVDYVILEMNKACEQINGVPNAAIGAHIRDLMPNIEQEWMERLEKVVLTGEALRYEQYVSELGSWFDLYTFRIGGEGSHIVANVFHNITDRKKAEEQIKKSEKQLRELSTELEQKVQQRTFELEEKIIELKNINTELEAFTYVSSHDLQEPLRKIQTLAGRIMEKEHQNLSDNGKNYFRLMQNAAQRMQTLIQDLLAFSKLNIADRTFEITNLNVLIEEIKKEFKEAIAEKNAVIIVKEICDVKIIPFQFRQLMHNLISNALKFSNSKIPPYITITSSIIKQKPKNINLLVNSDYCLITITDNGIGFEEEFSEKIFEVFQRLHDKEEYAGTGIGLAIVKKL